MNQDMQNLYDEQFYKTHSGLVGEDGVRRYNNEWLGGTRFLIDTFHPQRVLECGCATGGLVWGFITQGIEANGFDCSEWAVSHALPEIAELIACIELGPHPLPYPDNHFDLIVAIDFFEHLNPIFAEEALREVARVLRPGGHVFIRQPFTVWPDKSVEERHAWIASLNGISHHERLGLVGKVADVVHSTPDPPYHSMEIPRQEWVNMFTAARLSERVLSEESYLFPNALTLCSFNCLALQKGVESMLPPGILKIDGWMFEPELEWLYQQASSLPDGSFIVEIGTWKGRSTAALYEGAGSRKRVITIDTFRGTPSEMHAHWEAREIDLLQVFLGNMKGLALQVSSFWDRQTKDASNLQYLVADSSDASRFFDDGSIDWLFIDGDHSKCGQDIDVWLPKVKRPGIISGHDYFCFYEDIQQEIHKRFWIDQIVHSIWIRHLT